MRKVFALFTGLFLLSMLSACSEDSTTTPPPAAEEFGVLTAAVTTGYTCAPYNLMMEAVGGAAPYTWSLAEGSSLPDGLELQSDGRLIGVCMNTGDYDFSVRVEDSSETPKSAEREFSLSVAVPSNPSLAVYFDGEATVCDATTASWTWLTCYMYIMLDESEVACATACEFKLRIADVDGADLEAGTEYSVTGATTPDYVAITLGDLFSGMAIAFNRPQYGPAPIMVASFDILLLEDLQNLSFKFEANPGGSLGITSCDEGYPLIPVHGRETAINY